MSGPRPDNWLATILSEATAEVAKWPAWKRSDDVTREFRRLGIALDATAKPTAPTEAADPVEVAPAMSPLAAAIKAWNVAIAARIQADLASDRAHVEANKAFDVWMAEVKAAAEKAAGGGT